MKRATFLIAAVSAAALFIPAPASAQGYPVYPWCADYGNRGGTNCYFANLWQCRQAASGNGGVCYQNPFYGYAGAGQTPRRSGRRWQGQY